MHEFSGSEPLVGEIRALRTFRVDESGLLVPLFANVCWYDGENRAHCVPPGEDRGPWRQRAHLAPDDNCDCGIYAYGTLAAAEQNPESRYVLAVVSCWGRVIAGTRGVRAERARIEALWLHPNCPGWLAHIVHGRYPSTRHFTNREAMLAEYPPSVLDCYDPTPESHTRRKVAVAAIVATVLALGLLPMAALQAVPALFLFWGGVTSAATLVTLALFLRARDRGALDEAQLLVTVVFWLLAPLFTRPDPTLAIGLVMRMFLGIIVIRWVLISLERLRPHYFPVIHPPHRSAFDRLAAT